MKRVYAVILSMMAAALIILQSSVIYGNDIQARVFFDSRQQRLQLRNLHLDVIGKENEYLEIITDRSGLYELSALGFRTEVIHEDLQKYLQSRLDVSRSMGGYKTLQEINDYLDGIISDHQNIVSSKIDIGQTNEGRTMWAVKISDNPEVDEDEPEILYTAAIHSREVITPEVVFYFMDHLTDNYASDPDIQYLVDNREMWFIPMVNPDGYYYNQIIAPDGGGMWRKNRRDNGDGTWGVDLNRNFSYMWGCDDIGSSPETYKPTYRGTGPFSEPEAQNLRDFTVAHNFVIALYWHSYGYNIIWPWDYDYTEFTADQNLFLAVADSIGELNYCWPVVGWAPEIFNGSPIDWSYAEQTVKNKVLPFVIEPGTHDDHFWPPTNRIMPLVSENLQANIFLAEIAGDVNQILPPGAPEFILPEIVDNSWYLVKWTLDDPDNPAVYYELIEFQNLVQVIDPADNYENITVDGFEISVSRSFSEFSSFYSWMVNNDIRYLQLKEPLPVEENAIFSFWTFYRIEEHYDYAYVELSIDGQTFVPIEGNITTVDNPNGNNRGFGITGQSDGWVRALFDLSAYEGEMVYVRISYYTDETTVEEGMYIDDIHPVTTFAVENSVSSTIADTFYVFTDRFHGTDLYYKVRAQDDDLQWGGYSELKKTQARIPFTCGDVDDDESINILDIVFLINYAYKNGVSPDPLYSADVNNDEAINILDIVFLINYIYKSGPDPNCP